MERPYWYNSFPWFHAGSDLLKTAIGKRDWKVVSYLSAISILLAHMMPCVKAHKNTDYSEMKSCEAVCCKLTGISIIKKRKKEKINFCCRILQTIPNNEANLSSP